LGPESITTSVACGLFSGKKTDLFGRLGTTNKHFRRGQGDKHGAFHGRKPGNSPRTQGKAFWKPARIYLGQSICYCPALGLLTIRTAWPGSDGNRFFLDGRDPPEWKTPDLPLQVTGPNQSGLIQVFTFASVADAKPAKAAPPIHRNRLREAAKTMPRKQSRFGSPSDQNGLRIPGACRPKPLTAPFFSKAWASQSGQLISPGRGSYFLEKLGFPMFRRKVGPGPNGSPISARQGTKTCPKNRFFVHRKKLQGAALRSGRPNRSTPAGPISRSVPGKSGAGALFLAGLSFCVIKLQKQNGPASRRAYAIFPGFSEAGLTGVPSDIRPQPCRTSHEPTGHFYRSIPAGQNTFFTPRTLTIGRGTITFYR